MKPKYIYLIRHGESVGNVDKSIYKTVPDWKISLTEKGQAQARQAGISLRQELFGDAYYPANDVMIYTSPWYRTRETARIINEQFEARVFEDPRLREQEWGNFSEEHLSLKIEKERYEYGTFFYRMPYGESGADVYDRMSTFIETLHRDFHSDSFPRIVFIVTHGLTLRIFLMRWFHWSVEEFESCKNPRNCEIFKMEKEGDRYLLRTPLRKRKR